MRSNTSADSILNHWENPGVAGSQELRIQPGTTTMSMSRDETLHIRRNLLHRQLLRARMKATAFLQHSVLLLPMRPEATGSASQPT